MSDTNSEALAPRRQITALVSTDAEQAKAIAEVQASLIIAKKYPRDIVTAVDRITTACARPSFAERAMYEYARGGTDISGPSIRLMEEIARNWQNIVCGVVELARYPGRNGEPAYSECLAYAWDLETNFRDEKKFTVRHWRDTKSGGYALKDERDIYELIANMGARRKRSCIQALIPADVQENAVAECEKTLTTKGEVTPERVKSMLEKFAALNVTKEMIETRIQRRIDSITPALMVQLVRIYTSLNDRMSDVTDWFDVKKGQEDTAAQERVNAILGPQEAPEKTKPAAAAKAPQPPAEEPQKKPAKPAKKPLANEPPAKPTAPAKAKPTIHDEALELIQTLYRGDATDARLLENLLERNFGVSTEEKFRALPVELVEQGDPENDLGGMSSLRDDVKSVKSQRGG